MLEEWSYDDEALMAEADAASFIARRDDLASLFKSVRASYELDSMYSFSVALEDLKTLSAAHGLEWERSHLSLLASLLPAASGHYKARGLGEDMFHSSFDDLRIKERECHSLRGMHGVFTAYWIEGFYHFDRFGFGRLEAEIRPFQNEEYLRKGSPVINIHIPSSGPLKEEDCQESYETAAGFFADQASQVGGHPAIVTDSWLLNPVNKALGRASGIVRFASRYEVLAMVPDSSDSDAWRVFNTEDISDIQALPEDTRLQRIWKAHLASGGHMDRAYGVFFL